MNQLLDSVKGYVDSLFAEHQEKALAYHNIEHTHKAVAAATKIADHYQLDDDDYTAVIIAIWFHDTGYLRGSAEGHEARGVEIAKEYLQKNNARQNVVSRVEECIMATKMPQTPTSLISEIVCDADLYHLGTEDFVAINKLVRKEMNATCPERFSRKEWNKLSLMMLHKHQFNTDFCKTALQKGKQQNIEYLKGEIAMQKKEKKEKAAKQAKAEVNKRPARGIETMFRTTSTNHLRLSEMADSKANIMITVNSIIASILVSVLFRKLEDDQRLILPAILFISTSLVTIIFAILVTRPNVTQGTFTKDDIAQKKTNLLFFGNFHKMSLDDYKEGMYAMMQDADFLYGSMTKDIYNLGVVLGRKYRLLRITYSVFMYGFIISILAFVIAVTMF